MRLILIRHGQTTSNVDGLLDTGEPGADLTDLGREQAAALPQYLQHEGIEAVYTSTLVRTQQTAGPLATFLGLDLRVRDGLREIQAGDLEMLGDKASVRTYVDTFLAWAAGELHRRVPGGESGAEVLARYDKVVSEVAGSGVRTAAIVSHGAVIRSWTGARANNVSAEFAAQNPVHNTGIVVLDGHPQTGWRAVTWMGQAVGGPEVASAGTDGPAAETAPSNVGAGRAD